jgi:acid stress-induced BolA-like protein IbaG/YrbA
MKKDEILRTLQEALVDAEVVVKSDDETHFEAIIISDQFEGKSRIARHQLVYGCLGDAVGNEIHALSIKAYTNNEWKD